jgi:hypothetical protein
MHDTQGEECEEFEGSKEFELPGCSLYRNSLPVAVKMTDSDS